MDKIGLAKQKEDEAYIKYTQTRDIKYLKQWIECMSERERLIFNRISTESQTAQFVN